MRLQQYINETLERPSKEMLVFYEKRTKEHIDRVKNNIRKIISARKDLDSKALMARAKIHDKSKYSDEEYVPYVWLSWYHKEKNAGRKFGYPKGIKDKIKKSAKRHVTINRHHTNFHSNIKNMTDVDIAEMVADWAAMSQELDNSLREWADDNVGGRWKFSGEQTKLIYDLVDILG